MSSIRIRTPGGRWGTWAYASGWKVTKHFGVRCLVDGSCVVTHLPTGLAVAYPKTETLGVDFCVTLESLASRPALLADTRPWKVRRAWDRDIISALSDVQKDKVVLSE